MPTTQWNDFSVRYSHKANVARYHWRKSLSAKQMRDTLNFVYEVNKTCSTHPPSGWNDMIPINDYNLQRWNGYTNIPQDLLEKLGLLAEASRTYFLDWRVR